ncbi:3-oxoacyl-ACP synthase III family protein [Streptomyces violaceusniger]|uniref:3-oxoacyl-(Acyl-carrier-protein) synthase 3 n=1 Tax=Streptomyces violaceusniger (strain Tu 4113) TaxID=653045 RepID=G2PHK5_STRV4|nr:ketoacyl-ACP synthase III [Streptomyces violaceusniger]AEM89008.1 3-oxoacyl-(acyl-carrier-protein) synthase 3 [Streptomyces violaceusniger Tu 4113]
MERKAPIGVLGCGSYLPAERRSNEQVARQAGVSAEWIHSHTGVKSRWAAAEDEAASDLALGALRSALAAAEIEADQLGLIILATSTPDDLGPSTACRVQHAIKATRAVALDVAAACSGWLFAARVAHDWLRQDPSIGYAAVIGVEAYSKFINPADRATASLFGDGAAATILGPVPAPYGFGPFTLGSDGGLADVVGIPGGGSRQPDGDHTIHMKGRIVRDFVVNNLPGIIDDALKQHRITMGDVDHFVTHQPNPLLLRQVAEKVGIPATRLVVIGEDVGNIGAACIPYALTQGASQGRFAQGDLVLIAGFGAGFTWGSTLLTWNTSSAVCML